MAPTPSATSERSTKAKLANGTPSGNNQSTNTNSIHQQKRRSPAVVGGANLCAGQPSCPGYSQPPTPTLPHKGGGLFWLPPPLWGRVGVGGSARAKAVPERFATPAVVLCAIPASPSQAQRRRKDAHPAKPRNAPQRERGGEFRCDSLNLFTSRPSAADTTDKARAPWLFDKLERFRRTQ